MVAADQVKRRRSGTQHLDPFGRGNASRDRPGKTLRLRRIAPLHDERREPAIGRECRLLAHALFLVEEAVAVAPCKSLDERMIGPEGLDERPSRPVAASGPAGHLRQQLPGALARPWIAGLECKIRIHHARQHEMWKMMALGDKLRADHQIDLALLDLAQRIGEERFYLVPKLELTAFEFSGEILAIELPPKVDLRVTEAPPWVKGDTASGGTKTVLCEAGLKVQTPPFIEAGAVIRVNTRTGAYVERVEK